jgi:hypothetical protein
MLNESSETPRLFPVMNGDACAAFLINLGARGVEAFDQDEKSLGVFPDLVSAATAVETVTRKSVGPSSYSRGSRFELRLPDNRLRCSCCGHLVSAHAFDVIEPGFIRAVCAHCCADLLTIEMR